MMQKERYHYTQFKDPSGLLEAGKFCDAQFSPIGFNRMPFVFQNNILDPSSHEFDEDTFRRSLTEGDNTGRIPLDSRVVIDLEYPAWNVYKHLPEDKLWYQVNQPGIDLRFRILEVAKSARPDCEFGYYGQMPHLPYGGTLHASPRVQESRRHLAMACWSLAEQCDFLVAYFYDRKVTPVYDTFADRLRWVRTGLAEAKQFFPPKPVLGMLWMEYYDLWRARPDPDTLEAYRARQLSGYTWQEYHRLILELADGILYWGGVPWNTIPWDPTAEWWWVTQRGLH